MCAAEAPENRIRQCGVLSAECGGPSAECGEHPRNPFPLFVRVACGSKQERHCAARTYALGARRGTFRFFPELSETFRFVPFHSAWFRGVRSADCEVRIEETGGVARFARKPCCSKRGRRSDECGVLSAASTLGTHFPSSFALLAAQNRKGIVPQGLTHLGLVAERSGSFRNFPKLSVSFRFIPEFSVSFRSVPFCSV